MRRSPHVDRVSGLNGFRPLVIEEWVQAGEVWLRLEGELDLATKPVLAMRLRRLSAQGATVRLDLSRLEFVDATSTGLLLRALADSRRGGWRLLIDPVLPPQVARVFDLVGLELPVT